MKLIRIKYYESAIEANRDKQILLENGIESFIANEQTIQSDWLLSQAIGGLQLQVFEENVEKAKEILRNFDGCIPAIFKVGNFAIKFRLSASNTSTRLPYK